MKEKNQQQKATPKCIPCSFTCQFFSSDVFLSWSKSPDFTITTNTQDKSWNDVILTLTSTMVLMSFRLGVCRAQRNLTSRVLPQPVSPITITGMLHLNTQWDNHQDVAPEHTVGQSPGCCTWTHSKTITRMLHLNTQWDNHQDVAPEHTVRQSPGCCNRTHSGTITGMLHLNTQWDNQWDVYLNRVRQYLSPKIVHAIVQRLCMPQD